MDKATLRRELAARRDAVPLEEREAAARVIAANVAGLPEWEGARTVGLYASIRGEVPTQHLLALALRAGKVAAVPRVVGNDLSYHPLTTFAHLKPGAFGVPEPPAGPGVRPDLIVVPGLAFDPNGGRLGYGRGFFDRLLTSLPATSLAVAYDFQVLARLPQEAHDVPVKLIVTEARIVRPETRSVRPAPRAEPPDPPVPDADFDILGKPAEEA